MTKTSAMFIKLSQCRNPYGDPMKLTSTLRSRSLTSMSSVSSYMDQNAERPVCHQTKNFFKPNTFDVSWRLPGQTSQAKGCFIELEYQRTSKKDAGDGKKQRTSKGDLGTKSNGLTEASVPKEIADRVRWNSMGSPLSDWVN